MWVEVERGDHPGVRCRRVIIENPGGGSVGQWGLLACPGNSLCLWLKLAGAQHCGGRGAAGGRCCSRGEGLGHCQLSCILGNGVEAPLGWGTCQAHCQGRWEAR